MSGTSLARPAPLQVELDLFRGPLHTLLDLIERRELPITRVSLVEVADQYLALAHGSKQLDLDLTAEFLHVAARLLLLKSLALLPHVADEEPREDAVDDDLEARLLAYRRYRDAAHLLAARQEAGARMFPRAISSESPVALPTRFAVDPVRLRRVAVRAIERMRAEERARAAAPSPLVPFADVLRLVVEHLRLRRRTRLHDLVAEAGDVIVAITMFLAVLELVRQRRLSLHQEETFGPIELRVEGGPGDAHGR